MPNDDINPGDSVQLKSGGPIMTYVSDDDGAAACQWFDEKKILCHGSFQLVTLRAVETGNAKPMSIRLTRG